MTERELMQQALDYLDAPSSKVWAAGTQYKIIQALRDRLAQPEQEPTAYLCENAVGHKYFRWKKPSSEYKPIALYTAPPQRDWQGLTDEEIEKLVYDIRSQTTGVVATAYVARAIEAKLKEKNDH